MLPNYDQLDARQRAVLFEAYVGTAEALVAGGNVLSAAVREDLDIINSIALAKLQPRRSDMPAEETAMLRPRPVADPVLRLAGKISAIDAQQQAPGVEKRQNRLPKRISVSR